MEKSDIRYQAYVSILEEELKPAMGCTEPIAIAYCAAVAREVLGGLPEKAQKGLHGLVGVGQQDVPAEDLLDNGLGRVHHGRS